MRNSQPQHTKRLRTKTPAASSLALLLVVTAPWAGCAAGDDPYTANRGLSGAAGAGSSATEGGLPDANKLPLPDGAAAGASAGGSAGTGGSAGSVSGGSAGTGGIGGAPSKETCNNKDDDGDGVIDSFDEPCASQCGSGTRRCTAGVWGKCSGGPISCENYKTCKTEDMCVSSCPAAPKEACNNIDDDCDGTTDGFQASCSTMCGSGTRTCTAGKWNTCSAQAPLSCKNYHTCGMDNMCVSSCPGAPAEGCNLKDDDCDGKCDEGANCRIAVISSYKSSTGEFFYSTSASDATSRGFSIVNYHFYYLYKYQGTGLVPFYRCLLADGFHLYTAASNCEGSAGAKQETALGYISTNTSCGATILYRLYKNGSFFYTPSKAERDNAIAKYGYSANGSAGYVWMGP